MCFYVQAALVLLSAIVLAGLILAVLAIHQSPDDE